MVYGKGITGNAVKTFLISKGAKVFFYQDGEKQKFNPQKLDLVVISPGISLETSLCQEIIERNIPIISELELGFLNVKGNIIAITGTNGKTTTVTLLSKILNNGNTFLAGNVGLPLISLYNKTNESSLIVCEVSSYQLETCKTFKPKISAILNIAPDHLARHKSMENYIGFKAKIFKNQNEQDLCILNYEDEKVLETSKNCCAKKYYFSMENQLENKNFNGTYFFYDQIYFKDGIENVFVMETKNLKLIGKKNLENVLACCLIAKLCGVKNLEMAEKINNFLPLSNRLELVLETPTIKFINDSKATNVASSLADINAVDGKSVVIFGGSDKGEDFKPLFSLMPKNVLSAVLCGATAQKLKNAADSEGYKNYVVCSNLKQAIETAKQICRQNFSGEKINLILAPACASYDEFKNFEQRGEFFKNCVINGGNCEK